MGDDPGYGVKPTTPWPRPGAKTLPDRLDAMATLWWFPINLSALLREAAAEIRVLDAARLENRKRIRAAQEALNGGR